MTQTEVTKQEMQRQHAAANQKDPLVLACGRFLTSTVENNASMNRQPHESLSSFADCQPSTIRADIYVKRIMRYGGCSPSTLVLGLLYVERLKRKLLHVWITKQNIQRLFLVAVMEAVKHWEDFYYSNEHWAKIGGLTLKELNALEVEFLNLMNWELYVPADEYEALSASILEWQPLPKVVPQIEAEAKEDGDMSKVPRCLWDSCKTSAQVLASRLRTAGSKAKKRSSVFAASGILDQILCDSQAHSVCRVCDRLRLFCPATSRMQASDHVLPRPSLRPRHRSNHSTPRTVRLHVPLPPRLPKRSTRARLKQARSLPRPPTLLCRRRRRRAISTARRAVSSRQRTPQFRCGGKLLTLLPKPSFRSPISGCIDLLSETRMHHDDTGCSFLLGSAWCSHVSNTHSYTTTVPTCALLNLYTTRDD